MIKDELIEALDRLIEVKAEHDSERKKCVYDWSYFGHHEIDELNKAKDDFFNLLDRYIDDRIDFRLSQGDYEN